jgi:hypothetical protein
MSFYIFDLKSIPPFVLDLCCISATMNPLKFLMKGVLLLTVVFFNFQAVWFLLKCFWVSAIVFDLLFVNFEGPSKKHHSHHTLYSKSCCSKLLNCLGFEETSQDQTNDSLSEILNFKLKCHVFLFIISLFSSTKSDDRRPEYVLHQ